MSKENNMKYFIGIFIYLISLPIFAMVPKVVPNSESLFIRQHTPVWCWAATSSALYNYYHPQKTVTQESIAFKNPYVTNDNYIVPYSNPIKQSIPATHDYLLDEVLSSSTHKGYLKYFSISKAVKLLDSGNPFMLAQNFHVMIIYGYFKLQEHTYFLIFDPNGENFGVNPFMYASENNLVNMFGEPMAVMIFMKPKEEMLAHNITPMWN